MSHEQPKQLSFRSFSVVFVCFGYWDDFWKLIHTSDKSMEKEGMYWDWNNWTVFSLSNMLYIPSQWAAPPLPTAPLLAGFGFLLLLIRLTLILHLFCTCCFVSVASPQLCAWTRRLWVTRLHKLCYRRNLLCDECFFVFIDALIHHM